MSFVGGIWADRHSKKMLIIGSDALIALLTLGMVLLLPKFNDGVLLRRALFGPLADYVSLRLLMVVSSAILIALSLPLLPQAGLRRTS